MRIDLYRVIHKAQRHHLFGFAQQLGRADLDDESVRATMAAGVRHIVEMLSDHARNEEKYIHPLFAGLGGVEAIDEEHRELEDRLSELTNLVANGRWDAVYPCLMRLLGEYLLHIDGEERAQAEILWPRYSDAELAGVLSRFKAEREPAAAKADLELMIPALNVSELVGLLKGT